MKDKKWLILGNFKQVISQISIYFSVYSMIATSLILWHTTIQPWLLGHKLVISIWWFILLLTVVFIAIGILEWKKSLPGFFKSWTQQFYTEDNPLRQDLEQIKKDIKDLKDSK